MERLKLDQESIGLSSFMEKATGVRVKDCFKDQEVIYFIVASGELGKAIGKGGMNIHRVQDALKKKVKIIEYHADPAQFIRNVISPLHIEDVVEEKDVLVIKDQNRKTKGLIIGRDGKNLQVLNRAVQRFFNKEVKVA